MSDVEAAKYWLSWLELGSKVAILLVVMGVLYELVEKRFGAPLLKVIDNAREAELRQMSGQLSSAQLEIARLDNETAQAKAREAEANKVAEEEKLARIKIEQSLKPRVISPEDAEKIRVAISPFIGQVIDVGVNLNIPEVVTLTNQLLTILKAANWLPSAYVQVAGGRTVSDILVEVDPKADQKTMTAARALLNALLTSGLYVLGPAPAMTDHDVLGITQGSTSGPPDSTPPIRITIGIKQR